MLRYRLMHYLRGDKRLIETSGPSLSLNTKPEGSPVADAAAGSSPSVSPKRAGD